MTILSVYRGAPGARALGLIAIGLGSTCLTPVAYADPAPTIVVPLDFGTNVVRLDYGNTGTFLTGIRGDNIVGNYTIPDLGTTGGLYYNLTTETWSAMPVATPDGTNYPGSTGSSPYGPSFGNPGGVLRVVGSYQTDDVGWLRPELPLRRSGRPGRAAHEAGLSGREFADALHHRAQHLRQPGRRQLRYPAR